VFAALIIRDIVKYEFKITKDGDNLVSDETLNDESHNLAVKVDGENSDVYFEFSSREAMRDFALSLLHNSIFGDELMEIYPLYDENKKYVVNGVRLTPESSRTFFFLPGEDN
jgi:hypothetical protein